MHEEAMMTKTTFKWISGVFWVAFIAFIVTDTMAVTGNQIEPPPIAWGSGQAASGGHCSGR
jgi:hypothetical protein